MDLPHFLTSGMGGIRSAGDLVARMQFSKNMRVKDAKEYVAKKLGLDTVEIADEFIMRDVTGVPGATRGIAAKMNIENLLDIKINSCEKFREKTKR